MRRSFHSFDSVRLIKLFMPIRCDDIRPLGKDYISWLGMLEGHGASTRCEKNFALIGDCLLLTIFPNRNIHSA